MKSEPSQKRRSVCRAAHHQRGVRCQRYVQHYVALFSDITAHKAMEDQVHQMAYFDALTGSAQPPPAGDRLSQAMVASKRSGLYGALMFLDLDNFKPLNRARRAMVWVTCC